MDELERQIERLCPRCRQPLVIRTNRANGSEFFGCGSWPECSYTEPIPEYVRLRRAGVMPLPGME
jgi:ssDNA-binding Zn-finger/Zn-ribbon topoisomerase 1